MIVSDADGSGLTPETVAASGDFAPGAALVATMMLKEMMQERSTSDAVKPPVRLPSRSGPVTVQVASLGSVKGVERDPSPGSGFAMV